MDITEYFNFNFNVELNYGFLSHSPNKPDYYINNNDYVISKNNYKQVTTQIASANVKIKKMKCINKRACQ